MNITLSQITKKYGSRTVLDITFLSFQKGKIYALLGPNGSGKSTLLRLIAGMEAPDSGRILYDSRKKFSSGEIAYQPQNPYIFDFSVKKNILLGMGKQPGGEAEITFALEKLDMKSFKTTRSTRLSGGEAQRIVLARTLAKNSKAVLLDEPTSAEDIHGSYLIETYIRETCDQNNPTIIFSTHSPSQALRIADEVIFLWEGRIAEQGMPETVIHNPQSEEIRSFLQYWNS